MAKTESDSMSNSADTIPSRQDVAADSIAPSLAKLLKRVPADQIPASKDLLSRAMLDARISALEEPPLSIIVGGDVMLGGRAKQPIAENGPDYPFAAVLPLLQNARIVLANLEGPFAREARKQPRNFSYRVDVELASSLTRAGINVVTLANNHLMDCGREGVLETLDVLSAARVSAAGAGVNERAAHAPVILQAGRLKIGLLGYYWNRRTAATPDQPGSAMDPPDAIEADLRALRNRVDRIVVTFHWGVPYEREPSLEDRSKARFAIDCGADAVVGHHPHIVQPFEIYRGYPIFYSVGNFAFGSGNSRAEGLLIGIRFEETRTVVNAYPLYVKNRDPRVDYQPKVLAGEAGNRVLSQMAGVSGGSAAFFSLRDGWGKMELPWSGHQRTATESGNG